MATTTATTTATDAGSGTQKMDPATSNTSSAINVKSTSASGNTIPMRNPKDSMKSTWRAGDKSKWTRFHLIIVRYGLYYASLNKPIPVHPKSDKIPYVPEWQVHRWILWHAALPLVLHQAYVWATGRTVHPIAVAIFYSLVFVNIGQHQLSVMRRMGHQYGFLDGDKHQRDDVPDHSVAKTFISLILTVTLRLLMAVVLTYKREEAPIQMSWFFLPIEIGLYSVVLDFWFYWYHRVMHQFEGLWKYHRTHHLTKHPTALLTLYADTEQEIFDMVGIPFLAFVTMKLLGMPMSFYEWWVCHQYIVWTELCGHSGLRVHINTPTTFSWLLKYFDCELVVEDHDLHHRTGWKKSHNYGKQTRLWDRIFGTTTKRIESVPENIDWVNTAVWPIA